MSESKAIILLVDDSEMTRYANSRILKQDGYTVVEAASGTEALRQARNRPDLIILDVHLPDIIGFDVCRQLKEDPVTSAIPVLMMSATYISNGAVVAGLTGGADGYLTAAAEPQVLLAYVEALLRLRRAEQDRLRLLEELAHQHEQLQAVLQQMPVGVILAEAPSGRLIAGNDRVEEIWGHPFVPSDSVEEYRAYLGFHPDGQPYRPEEWPLTRAVSTGEVVKNEEIDFLRGDGSRGTMLVSARPVHGTNGRVTIGVAVFEDITTRKRMEGQLRVSLQEKEILLKEVHHRVKNNLQAIYNLLYMQSIYAGDERVREMFRQSQDRIKSIGLIHEKLYQTTDLVQLNFAEYVQSLAHHLIRSYGHDPAALGLRIETGQINLDIDQAVPLGVIINELISNSLKYAFPAGNSWPEGWQAELRIELNPGAAPGELILIVADNGVGLPAEVDVANSPSMGLQLVHTLAAYMKGLIDLDRDGGTRFTIRFEAPPKT